MQPAYSEHFKQFSGQPTHIPGKTYVKLFEQVRQFVEELIHNKHGGLHLRQTEKPDEVSFVFK